MYCPRCKVPVAAVKQTHGVRNFFAIPTMGMTGKIEQWHCPNCGGRVESEKGLAGLARRRAQEAERKIKAEGDARKAAAQKKKSADAPAPSAESPRDPRKWDKWDCPNCGHQKLASYRATCSECGFDRTTGSKNEAALKSKLAPGSDRLDQLKKLDEVKHLLSDDEFAAEKSRILSDETRPD